MKKFFLYIFLYIIILFSGVILVAAKKSIKILTLNTALLKALPLVPAPFGITDIGLKDNKKRAEMIANVIKNMTPDRQPDIIAVQEAFDTPNLKNGLYKNIKSIYPYANFDTRVPAFVGGVDSGLAIFSKFPFSKTAIEDFTCWRGDEVLARKGVMGTKIEIPGCPIYVFNTHLQAGTGSEKYLKAFAALRKRNCEGRKPTSVSTDEVRMMNLRQVKKFIEKFATDKTAPIFLVGDFNINYKSEKEWYDKIPTIFTNARDIYDRTSSVKSSEWSVSGKIPDIYNQEYRVDFVWFINKSNPRVLDAKSIIIQDFTNKMTDHLGVLATINLMCS